MGGARGSSAQLAICAAGWRVLGVSRLSRCAGGARAGGFPRRNHCGALRHVAERCVAQA